MNYGPNKGKVTQNLATTKRGIKELTYDLGAAVELLVTKTKSPQKAKTG